MASRSGGSGTSTLRCEGSSRPRAVAAAPIAVMSNGRREEGRGGRDGRLADDGASLPCSRSSARRAAAWADAAGLGRVAGLSSFAVADAEVDEIDRTVGVRMVRRLETARPDMAASAGSGRGKPFGGGGGGGGGNMLGRVTGTSRTIALREYVVTSSARFSPTLAILMFLTKRSQFGLARTRSKSLAADESPASIAI